MSKSNDSEMNHKMQPFVLPFFSLDSLGEERERTIALHKGHRVIYPRIEILKLTKKTIISALNIHNY